MRLFGKKKDKLGLCLSGGGALGFSHIGALQALEEYRIVPDQISGASIGAIIGVLYAEGYKAADILKIVKDEKMFKLSHLLRAKNIFLSEGLTDISKVEHILHKLISHNSFDKLKSKFYITIVDLHKPECRIVSSGENLIECVIASSSIPVIFEPKKHEGAFYVDGGVMNNFPVEPLLKNCQTVIGIDLTYPEKNIQLHSKIDILFRVYRIMTTEMQHKRIKRCHHYIPILGLGPYTMYDFDKLDELYQLGYDSVKEYFKKHKI